MGPERPMGSAIVAMWVTEPNPAVRNRGALHLQALYESGLQVEEHMIVLQKGNRTKEQKIELIGECGAVVSRGCRV